MLAFVGPPSGYRGSIVSDTSGLNFTTPLVNVRHGAVTFRNTNGLTVHTVVLDGVFFLAIAAAIVMARWCRRQGMSSGLIFPVFIIAGVVEKVLGSLTLWWFLIALGFLVWGDGSAARLAVATGHSTSGPTTARLTGAGAASALKFEGGIADKPFRATETRLESPAYTSFLKRRSDGFCFARGLAAEGWHAGTIDTLAAFASVLVASALAQTYKCNGTDCTHIQAYDSGSVESNLAEDYTRRSDGGTNNMYAGNDTSSAELLATGKMQSGQYEVQVNLSGPYQGVTGYFATSYNDQLAGNLTS